MPSIRGNPELLRNFLDRLWRELAVMALVAALGGRPADGPHHRCYQKKRGHNSSLHR
jgi:hypothetical protein